MMSKYGNHVNTANALLKMLEFQVAKNHNMTNDKRNTGGIEQKQVFAKDGIVLMEIQAEKASKPKTKTYSDMRTGPSYINHTSQSKYHHLCPSFTKHSSPTRLTSFYEPGSPGHLACPELSQLD